MAEQMEAPDEQQRHDTSPENKDKQNAGKPLADGSKQNDEQAESQKPPTDRRKKRRSILIGVTIAMLLLLGGFFWWVHARAYEGTDDAQIDGHLHPLSSRVDGTVLTVYAEDNQKVKAGDLLVQLDPKDYQVAQDQANASYHQAEAQTASSRPNVSIAASSNTNNVAMGQAQVASSEAAVAAAQQDETSTGAQLRQAEANNDKAQTDLRRYTRLLQRQEVAQSEYDQYLTTARAQAAAVEQQQATLRSAAKKVDESRAQLAEQQAKLQQSLRDAPGQILIRQATVASNQASAESAKAQAETAALRLSYTRIYAPVSGVVTERSAEMGSQVTTGQQLMMVVQVDNLWVTANYRETQLKKIHPGQKVRIHVDSLGEDFNGLVEAMPAASGDRTSVLPPENATGNYVKIVQRLPVRIRFAKDQHDLDRLRPGMSVEPKITLD